MYRAWGRLLTDRQDRARTYHVLRGNNSGSLAIFTAIRLASSLVSSLAADLPPRLILKINVSKLLSVVIADDEAGVLFFDGPGRREAAGGRRASRHGEDDDDQDYGGNPNAGQTHADGFPDRTPFTAW
jgi:hypothetical protein